MLLYMFKQLIKINITADHACNIHIASYIKTEIRYTVYKPIYPFMYRRTSQGFVL